MMTVKHPDLSSATVQPGLVFPIITVIMAIFLPVLPMLVSTKRFLPSEGAKSTESSWPTDGSPERSPAIFVLFLGFMQYWPLIDDLVGRLIAEPGQQNCPVGYGYVDPRLQRPQTTLDRSSQSDREGWFTLDEKAFRLDKAINLHGDGPLLHPDDAVLSSRPNHTMLWQIETRGSVMGERGVMGQKAHHYVIFETASGFCGVAWNSLGITRFQLPARSAQATERNLLRRLPGGHSGAPTPEVVEAVAAATLYFEGAVRDFSGFRLDLGEQDEYFKQIYAAVRRVAWGRTTTYGALAKELGLVPEAARDIGQAMAKNPVPLIIPCHRVLAAGGKIGGFSAPGGSAAKIRMLELEGIHVEPRQPAQHSFGL